MPTRSPALERLEPRDVPAHLYAVGTDPGVPAVARLIDADTGLDRVTVAPFGEGFTGGVRVAVGDVTGDRVPDLVVAPGPGAAPVVRVFDGVTGQPVAGPLGSLSVFDPDFRGGAFVAAGDVNFDGIADIVVGAGAGGSPVVSVIDGKTGATLATFLAYAPEFSGGVAVAAGDLDGDGRDDVITAPGPGGGPHVRAVSLAVNPAAPAELLSFFAYAPDFRGGTYLATGDVDSDGVTDIVTGTGPGGGCAVEAFRGSDAAPTGSFFAGDPADRGGVRVGVLDGTTIRAAVPTATGEAANLFTGSGQPLGPSDTAAGMVAGPAVAATNPAVLWNQVTLAAVQADRTLPPKVARDFAILHAAIFDAVNSVAPRYAAYHYSAPAPAGTSPEAAALAAGEAVLSVLFPARAATFATVLAGQLALLPDGAAKDQGLAVGRAAAADILALRQNDGSANPGTFTPTTDPGDWVPTPPGFLPYALPNWGGVTPFAIPGVAGFRPPAPPPLTSPEYAAAFNEVKALGRIDSTVRTAEQTQIALFWGAGAGTVTPPGMANEIAAQVVRRQGLDLLDSARVLALVNLAVADAGIVAWDAKRLSDWWRPVTAIREADLDGNPDTAPDPTWLPLLTTPNFPDHVSGHSTFSSAAAAVLGGLFGPDYHFRVFSQDAPGASRSFDTFAQAAEEAGLSRIYGGIHTSYANQGGLAAGQSVGEYVVGNLLKPV